MKILFCSPMLGCEGHYARYTALKAKAMADAGLDVTILGFPRQYDHLPAQERLRYVSVLGMLTPSKRDRAQKWRRRQGNYWTFIVEIWWVHWSAFKYAAQHNYDLVFISEVNPWLLLAGVMLARLFKRKTPVVGFFHNIYFSDFKISTEEPLRTRIQSHMNKFCIRFLPICINTVCGGDLQRQHILKESPERMHIISDGFDLTAKIYAQAEARQKLGLPLDRRMLLLFGVASQGKGAEYLFQALRGMDPLFDVCVVGKTGGVYMKSWGDEILKESRWTGHLRVVDRYVTDEERCLYYSACDGVVIPYRYGLIMLCGSLKDAIVYGKAAVVCDQFEIGKFTKFHQLGLTFTPESVPELRRALAEFASKPQDWFDAIAKRGQALAAEYSMPRMGERYRQLFEKLHGKQAALWSCSASIFSALFP